MEETINPLCECGCGERVRKPGNRFVKEHNFGKGGPIEVACAFCGETILRYKYEIEKYTNHYCSQECKRQWQSENTRAINNANWQGGKIEVTCSFCGEKILQNKSQVEKHNNHFCNKACYAQSQGGSIEITCDLCGRKFLQRKSQVEKYSNHFCSTVCAGQWKSENVSGANSSNWQGGLIEVTCAFCGETILRNKCRLKNGKNYFCSRVCSGQWQSENLIGAKSPGWHGGSIEVTCTFCGETILRAKSRVKNASNHFCDKECQVLWQLENMAGSNSPAWKGGSVEVACAFCGETILRAHNKVEKSNNHFCNAECKGQWKSENEVGPKNPSWQGGKSFEPYTTEFNGALKRAIRERDGFTCRLCGVSENGQAHDCHHIDYVKQNNNPENFSLLCHACHGKTGINRAFWTSLFQAQVKLREWRIQDACNQDVHLHV